MRMHTAFGNLNGERFTGRGGLGLGDGPSADAHADVHRRDPAAARRRGWRVPADRATRLRMRAGRRGTDGSGVCEPDRHRPRGAGGRGRGSDRPPDAGRGACQNRFVRGHDGHAELDPRAVRRGQRHFASGHSRASSNAASWNGARSGSCGRSAPFVIRRSTTARNGRSRRASGVHLPSPSPTPATLP